MNDYLASIKKLRKDAAECALIRDLATDKTKRKCTMNCLNTFRIACRSEEVSLELDQADTIGVLPSAGMKSTSEKQSEEETTPPRSSEFRRLLKEYAADLRAIIDKLRRKLN